MTPRIRAVLLATVLVPLAPLALASCESKGPMERAGEKIDKSAERARDKLENKGPAEKAGEKVDEATGQD
ncbi:MAG TPA: hypothetical protein VFD84_11370 [Candidatus Binatia bacterium]|nr:hypothetical protein [Candidatus Binatia bacterium]